MRDQRALEFEATRAGLVATLHRLGASYPLDKAQDGGNVRRQVMQRRRVLPGQHDRGDGCGRVLIARDDGSRLRHDRPPLYAALRWSGARAA